jgi:uncharacterized membrane protein YhaH (DUF805 family)
LDEQTQLRRRDFWTAIILMAGSAFMLLETGNIPFFDAQAAGVESGKWFNSAAIVPYLIFGLLLAFSISLLVIAIRDGGAPRNGDLAAFRTTLVSVAAQKFFIICAMLLIYIFGLVPRVDFVLATAVTMMALTYGYFEGRLRPAYVGLACMAVPGLYALAVHFPSEEWAKPHDDDWLTLASFVLLTAIAFIESRKVQGKVPLYLKWAPFVCVLTPLFLVCAMAFGFRQNVPNRTGLIFSQIEYHYYVTLKPLFGSK